MIHHVSSKHWLISCSFFFLLNNLFSSCAATFSWLQERISHHIQEFLHRFLFLQDLDNNIMCSWVSSESQPVGHFLSSFLKLFLKLHFMSIILVFARKIHLVIWILKTFSGKKYSCMFNMIIIWNVLLSIVPNTKLVH
jgi:hypothetical protein